MYMFPFNIRMAHGGISSKEMAITIKEGQLVARLNQRFENYFNRAVAGLMWNRFAERIDVSKCRRSKL